MTFCFSFPWVVWCRLAAWSQPGLAEVALVEAKLLPLTQPSVELLVDKVVAKQMADWRLRLQAQQCERQRELLAGNVEPVAGLLDI